MKLKNRILSGILTGCLLLSLVPMTAAAETEVPEGLSYKITDEGTVTITDMDESYEGALAIPDTIEGYPVTVIDGEAFEDCTGLTSVEIPEGISTIGGGAFIGCTGLTEVAIPATVADISSDVFTKCSSLTAINVKDNNPNYTSIDGVLFTKDGTELIACPNGITGRYTVPSGTTEIGKGSFHSCTGLTSVIIPEGVTMIRTFAFGFCSNLTAVLIPTTMTEIENVSFYECTNLTDVYYTGTKEQWDAIEIAMGNEELDDINIYCNATAADMPDDSTPVDPDPDPDDPEVKEYEGLYYSVYEEYGGAVILGHSDAYNPSEAVIPDTIEGYPVIIIAEDAFRDCTNLTSVAIPDSVLGLAIDAFYGCTGLTEITIPAGVSYIAENVFCGCTSLEAINVDPDNTTYASDNGVLFSKDMSELILYPEGLSGACAIPDSVTDIGKYAFDNCTGLTAVLIPASVTDIGENVFCNCDKLTEIYYTGTEEQWAAVSIDEGNEELTGVNIHYNATAADLPDEPAPVDPDPTPNPDEPEVKEYEGLLYEIVYFNDGVLITGISSEYDSTELIIPEEIDGYPVTDIDAYAFKNCTGLTSVVLPESVTYINWGAFYGCTALQDVYYLGTEEQWNEVYIDADNEALKNANIQFASNEDQPDEPEKKEYNGLYYQASEEYGTVVITGISDAYNQTNLVIPETIEGYPVVVISDNAFEDCTGLTSVTIPENVEYIGGYAFSGCTGLMNVVIPESVTRINWGAFYGCTALKDVYYAGTEAQWNQIYIEADNEALKNAALYCSSVAAKFTDVVPGKWYVPYIQTAVDNKFMSGTSDTTFEPNGTATRAMFVQILYAMAGKPDITGLTCPFADVISGKWYYNAVVWAYNNEVTAGTSDTTFGTNDPITREQVALLLYAYEGRPEVSGELEGFADTASVHSWAYNGMLWANQNKIVNGSNDNGALYLNPLKNASRAEIATMMSAFYQLVQAEEADEGAPVVPDGRRIAEEACDYFGGMFTGTDGMQIDLHMYTYSDSPYDGKLELIDQNGNTLYDGEFQKYLTNYYGLANGDLTMTIYTDNDNNTCLDVYENGEHLDYFTMTIPYVS